MMRPRLIIPALGFVCAAALLVAQSRAQSPLSSGSKASDLDALKNTKFGSTASSSGGNLVPNWNFSDPKPLNTYRYDFPYQDWYVDNAKYLSQVTMQGKSCAQLDLPAGIAGNQGAKIETALVPCIPGATYRAEVECMTNDFGAKIHAEVYAPLPAAESAKLLAPDAPKTTINRIPAMDNHPALVMIYRAQFSPDPPASSKKWDKVVREFTVPLTWKVAGANVAPTHLTIKATVFAGTPNGGKSYFTEFKITKIKDPGAAAAPETSGPASNKKAILR